MKTPKRNNNGSRGRPIWVLLVWSMVLVAIVPVGLLSFHLYHSAWDNAWREINEKHRLLAQNMASPVRTYVFDHRNMLGQLSETLGVQIDRPAQAQLMMEKTFKYMEGFQTLALVDQRGMVTAMVHRGQAMPHRPDLFLSEPMIQKTRERGEWQLSSIQNSRISSSPIFLMTLPVFDRNERMSGVLLGELRIDLIEELRKNIHFGEKGHSAIVDATGRVIAHPNPEWMREIRDLSHLSVVKKMMAGEMGVTEFYSPFIKSDMVAGYTSVRDLGWGIMVPQPKSEVENQVNQLMSDYLLWVAAGIVLAVLAGFLLVRWIVTPINLLAASSRKINKLRFSTELEEVSASAPREIQELRHAFHTLIANFRLAQLEVRDLNMSLKNQQPVSNQEFEDVITRVETHSTTDFLTDLPGYHILQDELVKRLDDDANRQELCLVMIGMANRDSIIRKYGHGMNNEVIRSLARILESRRDYNDLLARYAEDAFVFLMQSGKQESIRRTDEIIQKISEHSFQYNGKQCSVSTSVAMLCFSEYKQQDVDVLFEKTYAELKAAGNNNTIKIGLV